MGFGQRPEGGHHDKRTGIPQTTDDWPIFPDNTDWVTLTWSSVATLLANSFESGSAAIQQRTVAVRRETSIMYINIISGQTLHSPDDGGGYGLWNIGLLSTACCPRRFDRVQLQWKHFYDIYLHIFIICHNEFGFLLLYIRIEAVFHIYIYIYINI
jgi:hypothetical protein